MRESPISNPQAPADTLALIASSASTAIRDENGDTFEVWIVRRSFAILGLLCKLGLGASLLYLCVVDPIYFFTHLLSNSIPLTYMVAWHVVSTLHFAGFLLLHAHISSHAARLQLLTVFFVATLALFVWFGVLSFLGKGDFSVVSLVTMVIATVLNFPGKYRRALYFVQALSVIVLIVLLDSSGVFIGKMLFSNVLLLAVVAYVIDGYMRSNALDLFHKKCQVAHERNRADTVLYNALPLAIADQLKVYGQVKAQSYPHMSILFTDIVGFTQFAADHAPDEVLAVLDTLFSEMDALVEVYQVEKIKTIGDAYMAISKTQADALAHLAIDLLNLMQRLNAELDLDFSLRIGLHCGPAIAGVLGHKRISYDVWGDTVNMASRMESSGAAGQIHVSEDFYLALQERFHFEDCGLRNIKGKGMVRTYFLLGTRPASGVIGRIDHA